MITDIHTHQTAPTRHAIGNLFPSECETMLTGTHIGYYSVGLHPWHIATDYCEQLEVVERFASHPNVVWIGECGLDKYAKSSIERQTEVLTRHILISEKVQKPLLIHCVGRFNELFALKRKLRPQQRWIIHGFRGKPQLVQQAIKEGCALSFGAYFNPDAVKRTPLDKLYLETDESNLPFDEICRLIAEATNIDLSLSASASIQLP